jgi:hypothetical protein
MVIIGSRVSIAGSPRLATVLELRANGKVRVRWDGHRPGNLGKEHTVDAASCVLTDAPAWYINAERWKKKEQKQQRRELKRKRQEAFRTGEVKPRWFCFDCDRPEPLKNKKKNGLILCIPCWSKRESLEHSRVLLSKPPQGVVVVNPSVQVP